MVALDNLNHVLRRAWFFYAVRWGKLDKAIADYTEAIRLDPDYADAYLYRSVIYSEKVDQAKAETDFAKAKELGY